MDELPVGIRRVTLPLPTRPGHVHCYALPGEDGWTLVDTGLGLPDAGERWQREIAALDGPVTRLVVTHFHPDHVGAASDVAELTGASVLQGELDYQQCVRVWGSPEWPAVIADWFIGHGVPADVAEELLQVASVYTPFIRFALDPLALRPGEHLDGWEPVAMPGHADGQVCLLKDGILIAGDHVLAEISPAVGLYPASRPDPLGDYLASLERTIELAPRLALPGHGEPIENVPGRARELIEHHRIRLDETEAALGAEARTGYDVSLDLFGDELGPSARRFAVAETLSHLERLVVEGRARRREGAGTVAYTSA